MEKKIDLIGIGECLVEFSDIGNGQYQIGYSGDVLNALAAAGRLGLSTGLLSATGDDPFTEGLRHILNVEHIDLSHAPILEGKPNGVYFLSIDAMGLPTFHFLRKNSAARDMFNAQPLASLIEYARSARALLFSSIPLAVIKDRDKLLELMRAVKGETILAFDLNIRRILWDDLNELVALLSQLAPLIDALFITNEDDTILFGPRHATDALTDYVRRGFRQVVIRRGGLPTLVSSDGESFEVPVPHVANIIDTTGAGDAFDAGYIAAMLRNHQSYECAAMGNATAAVSLESRGGRAVGLTIERVEKLYRPLVKWGTFHVPTHR
jgi:2-dehydro-3-deoxygluconokinase